MAGLRPKAARTNPAALLVLAVLILASALGTVVSSFFAVQATRHAATAQSQAQEQEEQRKRAEEGATVPVLQVADIDFSYGPVQVLFDVNFEVHRGETLALLGTNGAGKSTILRVISGLEVPERGVVRLNGQNITYVTPEARARLGIIELPGGKGVCKRTSTSR